MIKSGAWDTANFSRNPIFLWAHSQDDPPIGRVIDISEIGGKLRGTVEYASADLSPFADSIFRMAKEGYLNATSVSWLPREFSYSQDRSRPGGIDFSKVELLEVSQVRSRRSPPPWSRRDPLASTRRPSPDGPSARSTPPATQSIRSSSTPFEAPPAAKRSTSLRTTSIPFGGNSHGSRPITRGSPFPRQSPSIRARNNSPISGASSRRSSSALSATHGDIGSADSPSQKGKGSRNE